MSVPVQTVAQAHVGRRRSYARLALVATVLALVVVVLGAYVRLSDAGLGCPDWPGCYGGIAVPSGADAARASEAFPERPLEAGKAFKEMLHRYFAGALGVVILLLAVLAWRRREALDVRLPVLLVALVTFQALLGMWTVTLLLKPVIVMAHLLGGFATLALLWWLTLRHRDPPVAIDAGGLKPLAVTALVVLVGQIALGGWTSSNYAALACVDFPTCRNAWWPQGMDYGEAFVLWRGLGVDYEGGVLADGARVAIHFTHRLGAVVTTFVLASLALTAIAMRPSRAIMRAGIAVAVLLAIQVALGIGNVVLSLPLGVATAHNGVAALLLLSVVTVLHLSNPPLPGVARAKGRHRRTRSGIPGHAGAVTGGGATGT